MAKYQTKEEAIKAVSIDGMLLYEVDEYLKDDEDIVLAAIRNGGLLEQASARLENSTEFVLEKARFAEIYSSEWGYYDKALFCAKRDWKLCQKFARVYNNIDEYHIQMLLTYGQKYKSPIKA